MFEAVDMTRWLLACVAITLMLGALVVILQKLRMGQNFGPQNSRLQVLETRSLDARHRLVLVRHDEAEHLLLLGGTESQLLSTQKATTGKRAKNA